MPTYQQQRKKKMCCAFESIKTFHILFQWVNRKKIDDFLIATNEECNNKQQMPLL